MKNQIDFVSSWVFRGTNVEIFLFLSISNFLGLKKDEFLEFLTFLRWKLTNFFVVEWIIMIQNAKSRFWDLVFHVLKKCAKFEINRMSRFRATVITDFQKPWFEKNEFKKKRFFVNIHTESSIPAPYNEELLIGKMSRASACWCLRSILPSVGSSVAFFHATSAKKTNRSKILQRFSWQALLSNKKRNKNARNWKGGRPSLIRRSEKSYI